MGRVVQAYSTRHVAVGSRTSGGTRCTDLFKTMPGPTDNDAYERVVEMLTMLDSYENAFEDAEALFFKRLDRASGGFGHVDAIIALRLWPKLTQHAGGKWVKQSGARLHARAAAVDRGEWLSWMRKLCNLSGLRLFLGNILGSWAQLEEAELEDLVGVTGAVSKVSIWSRQGAIHESESQPFTFRHDLSLKSLSPRTCLPILPPYMPKGGKQAYRMNRLSQSCPLLPPAAQPILLDSSGLDHCIEMGTDVDVDWTPSVRASTLTRDHDYFVKSKPVAKVIGAAAATKVSFHGSRVEKPQASLEFPKGLHDAIDIHGDNLVSVNVDQSDKDLAKDAVVLDAVVEGGISNPVGRNGQFADHMDRCAFIVGGHEIEQVVVDDAVVVRTVDCHDRCRTPTDEVAIAEARTSSDGAVANGAEAITTCVEGATKSPVLDDAVCVARRVKEVEAELTTNATFDMGLQRDMGHGFPEILVSNFPIESETSLIQSCGSESTNADAHDDYGPSGNVGVVIAAARDPSESAEETAIASSGEGCCQLDIGNTDLPSMITPKTTSKRPAKRKTIREHAVGCDKKCPSLCTPSPPSTSKCPQASMRRNSSEPLPALPHVPLAVPTAVRLAKAVNTWKAAQDLSLRAGNVVVATKTIATSSSQVRRGQWATILSVEDDSSSVVLRLHGLSEVVHLIEAECAHLETQVLTHKVDLINGFGQLVGKTVRCMITEKLDKCFYNILCEDGREQLYVHRSFLHELCKAAYTDLAYVEDATASAETSSDDLALLPPPGFLQTGHVRVTVGSAMRAARSSRMAQCLEPPGAAQSNPIEGSRICPFMEIQDAGLKAMLSVCTFTANDIVFDLGCGTGKILERVLETCPCRGVGVEVNTSIARSAEQVLYRFLHRVRVVVDDARNVDLSEATAVMSYFLSDSFRYEGASLREHLSSSLRPGSVVYNYTYPIPGWNGLCRNGVHIYTIGRHLPSTTESESTELA